MIAIYHVVFLSFCRNQAEKTDSQLAAVKTAEKLLKVFTQLLFYNVFLTFLPCKENNNLIRISNIVLSLVQMGHKITNELDVAMRMPLASLLFLSSI